VQKALADIAAHLAPIADSASQLDLLANVSGLQGNLDEVLAYEKRAVSADPNCVPCLAEAATVMYGKGLTGEALRTAIFALGLLPEGRSSRVLDGLIERCRAKLAASAATPAPGAPATPPQRVGAKGGGSPTQGKR
jgi:hypothetical protein